MDQAMALWIVAHLIAVVVGMVAAEATGTMVGQWRSRRHGRPKGKRPIYVLEYPQKLSTEARKRLCDEWSKQFPDQRCVVLDDGAKLRVVEPENKSPELSEAAVKQLRKSWEDMHRGLEGRRTPTISTITHENKSPELVRRRMYDGEVIDLRNPGYIGRDPEYRGTSMLVRLEGLRRLECSGPLVFATSVTVLGGLERQPYLGESVTVMAPPVKSIKIGTATIDLTLLGTKELQESMRRLSERFRRAYVPLPLFGRAGIDAGITKPESIGRPADFVYSMGRRRWFGGWRLARRLAWAVALAGVGGAWWWTR